MLRKISWRQIEEAVQKTNWPKVGLVVGIARNGIIPAVLIAKHLNKEVKFVRLKYRDDNQQIIFHQPKVIEKPGFVFSRQRILLVDDVSRSGKTLTMAQEMLKNKRIITCVLTGQADIVLLNSGDCFDFPWHF